jgi:4-phytase / acid phosphatase
MPCASFRLKAFLLAAFILCDLPVQGQSSAGTAGSNGKLRFVVYLSRHGVRSPTSDPARYDAYSVAPWPHWSVPPGYLTPHGFELMKLFGAYDRAEFAGEGLFAPTGCTDASRIAILADSDERTRETGKALAAGMFPGCSVTVHALPEGDPDPLFHAIRAGVGKPDNAMALAAIEGRIGGRAANLTDAYRTQLEALDRILAGCGKVPATNPQRSSIFDLPNELAKGKSDHAADLHGPLSLASSMTESLLLEYADGMKDNELGWGCLDEPELRHVMQLHTAEVEYSERTPYIARMDASNLFVHILAALEQSAVGKPLPGAPGKPGDRALFLIGHDTNIATVAGMLDLNWILDGRRDDTPPGGALIFELWQAPSGTYSVLVYYTAQTLDQMRDATSLTLARPPERVPVFVPGCSRPDMSCTLDSFAATVRRVVDPVYVKADLLGSASW